MVLLGQLTGSKVFLTQSSSDSLVHIEMPDEFAGERVHFIWDNSSEALLYRDGVPVQAFYGSQGDDRREEYLLSPCAKAGEVFEFVVEMVWNCCVAALTDPQSCNGMFGNPAPGGFLNAPVDDLTFKLAAAELATLNVPAWNLFWDFDIILGMAKVRFTSTNMSSSEINFGRPLLTIIGTSRRIGKIVGGSRCFGTNLQYLLA